MDTLLFFDRWMLLYVMSEYQYSWYNDGTRSYLSDMEKALSRYLYVISFCKRKAPECTDVLNKVLSEDTKGTSETEAPEAEAAILSAIETFVVYAYPEVTDQVAYIRNGFTDWWTCTTKLFWTSVREQDVSPLRRQNWQNVYMRVSRAICCVNI